MTEHFLANPRVIDTWNGEIEALSVSDLIELKVKGELIRDCYQTH